MADENVVKTITIKGTTQGVDDATASVKALGDAMADVNVVSDESTKSTTSVQNALDRQQRSLDSTYRAQINLSASQKIINDGLNQGLITQDRANQLLDLAKDKFDKATASASPFAKAVQGVQTQLVALAAGAGPIGVFLASFGPLGLAAAAGVGLVEKAFTLLSAAAAQVGQHAQELRTFGQVTGLTTDDIQKLQEQGAAFGISTDDITRSLDQFSVRLTNAKNLTGPYYDQLVKINPALAQQVLTTKSYSDQLLILAQAYQQAGDRGNALLNSALGRNGVGLAPLLGAIGSAGGASNLPGTPGLSPADVQRMAATTAEMDASWERIKTNIGAIAFSPQAGAQSLAVRHDIEAITDALRNFSPSSAWTDFTNWLNNKTGGALGQVLGGSSGSTFVPNLAPAPAYPPALNTIGLTGPAPALTLDQQAAQAKGLVTALGPLATATEQYNAKLLTLKSSTDFLTLSDKDQQRAIQNLNVEFSNTAINARVAVLGQMAPVSDLVAQAQDRINKANLAGAGITDAQTKAILANVAAQKQSSDTQILVANNVATAEGLRVTKLSELNVLVLQGKLTQDQATTSLQAYEKVIEQTIQTQEVAKATFTNLAQLQQQAGSLRGQLDTFATDTSNNIGNAFVDIATGAKSAKDAFANLEQQVIKSLINMVVQMAIVKPIAQSLNAILGAFLPGGGSPLAGSLPLGSGGIGHAALGNVYDQGRVMLHPFALGGIVSDIVTKPTLFPMAAGAGLMGEAGPEAVMPLTRGANGKLGVQTANGGGIVVQQNIQINNTRSNDTDVSVSQGPDPETIIISVMKKAETRGDLDGVRRGRFGLRPQKVT